MPRRPVFITAFAALVSLTVVGTFGYMSIAGMSFEDAAFMTFITLSTVGYGEVQPLSTGGRVFTIVLLCGGLGIVFYSIVEMAGDLIEGGVQRAVGRWRVQRQIEQLSDHYIICGAGRMGQSVCRELAAKPVPFVVIERDNDRIRQWDDKHVLVVKGDATEDEVLLQAGLKRARGLVSALPSDADNVYVVLTAREMRPDLLIVARAQDERSERKLLAAGATRVVLPYVIGGVRMANALLRPAVLDVIDLATHHSSIEICIEEMTIPAESATVGKCLSDLRGDAGDIIVIAVKKPDGHMLFHPATDYRIVGGDRIVLIGQPDHLKRIEQET